MQNFSEELSFHMDRRPQVDTSPKVQAQLETRQQHEITDEEVSGSFPTVLQVLLNANTVPTSTFEITDSTWEMLFITPGAPKPHDYNVAQEFPVYIQLETTLVHGSIAINGKAISVRGKVNISPYCRVGLNEVGVRGDEVCSPIL